MNWMIDGAHGDLYRSAMGYAALKPAVDEWEAERQTGRKARATRHPVKARLRLLRRLLRPFSTPHRAQNHVPTMEGFVS
jgi:hypothetical protein